MICKILGFHKKYEISRVHNPKKGHNLYERRKRFHVKIEAAKAKAYVKYEVNYKDANKE